MRKNQRQRIDIEHGLYRIIAGQQGKSFKAIAYVGMRKVAETCGENAEEAINSLKALLDATTAKRKEARKEEVPSTAEFKDALESLRACMPRQLMDILTTHRRLPDDTATMLQLARISSAWTPTVTEVEYARLGRKISRLLGFSPVTKGLEPHLIPIGVFATPKGSVHKGTWKLRPQFAAALDELKRHVPAKRPNGAAASVVAGQYDAAVAKAVAHHAKWQNGLAAKLYPYPVRIAAQGRSARQGRRREDRYGESRRHRHRHPRLRARQVVKQA